MQVYNIATRYYIMKTSRSSLSSNPSEYNVLYDYYAYHTALQCLTYTPPFANYILARGHAKQCKSLSFITFLLSPIYNLYLIQPIFRYVKVRIKGFVSSVYWNLTSIRPSVLPVLLSFQRISQARSGVSISIL